MAMKMGERGKEDSCRDDLDREKGKIHQASDTHDLERSTMLSLMTIAIFVLLTTAMSQPITGESLPCLGSHGLCASVRSRVPAGSRESGNLQRSIDALGGLRSPVDGVAYHGRVHDPGPCRRWCTAIVRVETAPALGTRYRLTDNRHWRCIRRRSTWRDRQSSPSEDRLARSSLHLCRTSTCRGQEKATSDKIMTLIPRQLAASTVRRLSASAAFSRHTPGTPHMNTPTTDLVPTNYSNRTRTR